MSLVPDPADRNRQADLPVHVRRVVKDLLSFSEGRLNPHIAETPDLAIGYVEESLGLRIRIPWGEVPDGALPKIKTWQDYCLKLFDSVESFVLDRL
jgi:hypothetical protein